MNSVALDDVEMKEDCDHDDEGSEESDEAMTDDEGPDDMITLD